MKRNSGIQAEDGRDNEYVDHEDGYCNCVNDNYRERNLS